MEPIDEQAENKEKEKEWDMTGPTGTSTADLFRASTRTHSTAHRRSHKTTAASNMIVCGCWLLRRVEFRSGGRDLRSHRVPLACSLTHA